jgi:phosphoglycerate kinase
MAIGKSLFDEDGAKHVADIIQKAREKNVKLYLPFDHVIGDKFSADAKIGVTDDALGVPENWLAMDIGPRSRMMVAEVMMKAKTILWNGPLGVYEMAPFAAGTISAMGEMVAATRRGATTIIGGGDTGAASAKFMYGSKPIAGPLSSAHPMQRARLC